MYKTSFGCIYIYKYVYCSGISWQEEIDIGSDPVSQWRDRTCLLECSGTSCGVVY